MEESKAGLRPSSFVKVEAKNSPKLAVAAQEGKAGEANGAAQNNNGIAVDDAIVARLISHVVVAEKRNIATNEKGDTEMVKDIRKIIGETVG